MSTQFFSRQEAARTNTAWLVVLFSVAVIGIVGAASVVGYLAAASLQPGPQADDTKPQIDPIVVASICGCAAGIVIVLGSLYQVFALRTGGGSGVAESIGGRPLIADTATMEEKRLLNVVEEMAIASGIPVPPVYLLDEPGINAFAAGYRPSDAVVGVTRGAIENLNREQLQGVIAHEFSHILNGDMRMNIRMIGILHGILLLTLIGRMLFHSMRFMGASRSSNDDKGRIAIVLLLVVSGVALIVIGGIGSLIGGLIKSAVCRQREYLADASAVQFTRNPGGIAGALKRIGAIAAHGRLNHPNASVASHLFFSQGVFEGFSGLLATHPPLPKRILAIDPRWDGRFEVTASALPSSSPKSVRSVESPARVASPLAMGLVDLPSATEDLAPVEVVRAATEHVGSPESAHQLYSANLLEAMHPVLRQAAGEPYSARALVFALLLDRDPAIAMVQLAHLRTTIAPPIVQLTERLAPMIAASPEAMRLPMVDLALPMLRRMSVPQYEQFVRSFDELVKADDKLSLFEWTLAQVLKRNLRSQYQRASGMGILFKNFATLHDEVSTLLSMLARVGHSQDDMSIAFETGLKALPGVNGRLLPANECSFQRLEMALKKLRRTSEKHRGELLDACAACVTSDGVVMVREAELLRGIADLLECPMPPLIAEMQAH